MNDGTIASSSSVAAPDGRFPWARKLWDTIRPSLTVKALGIALTFLGVLAAFVKALDAYSGFVIMPVVGPEKLDKRGFGPAAISERLQDQMEAIRREARDRLPSYDGAWDNVSRVKALQDFDRTVPDAGVKVSNVVDDLRSLLGMDSRFIRGEIACSDEECRPEGLSIRLRVLESAGRFPVEVRAKASPQPTKGDNGAATIANTAGEIDDLLRECALGLLEKLEPLTFAAWIYSANAVDGDDKARATRAIRRSANAQADGDGKAARYNALGTILLAAGMPEDAAPQFASAIGVATSPLVKAEAHAGRAQAYATLREFERAGSDYEAALKDLPATEKTKMAELQISLGLVSYHQGEVESALSHYDKALAINPANPDALINKGYALAFSKRFDEALDAFRQAADPAADRRFAATFGQGVVHYLNHDFQASAKSFAQARRLKPDDGNALVWHLLARLRNGPQSDDLGKLPALTDEWRQAVVNYLLSGEPNALLEKADHGPRAEDMRTEAYFYIASRDLAFNDGEGAKAMFNAALSTGRTDYLEYRVAACETTDCSIKAAENK